MLSPMPTTHWMLSEDLTSHYIKTVLLNFKEHSRHLGGCDENAVSDSVGPKWGLRVRISRKLPCDADVVAFRRN